MGNSKRFLIASFQNSLLLENILDRFLQVSIMRGMEKMRNKLYQLGLGVILPVLAGCKGGGSASTSSFSSIGSLFAGADSSTGGTTTLASLSSLSTISSFSTLTSSALTNPEPASLLLMGGGLMALGYLKGLKKKLR